MTNCNSSADGPRTKKRLDAEIVVVGAGISGIGAGIFLKNHGHSSCLILEASGDLGGTWRDNRYPGVAVDIPSECYCFSFEPNYPWSRVYAPGSEIQNYLRHCARKFGIDDHIRYRAKVVSACFDEADSLWVIELSGGELISARFLILATGIFGAPKIPPIPGLDRFSKKKMHTLHWDHDYDFSSRRVAIIGTGPSAVQIVPELAKTVDHLTVFQRTPIYVAPRFDHAIGTNSLRQIGIFRSALRLFSDLGLAALSFAAVNFERYPWITFVIQRQVRNWMGRQVWNPETRDKLIPRYDLGCKRPALSRTYLASFNRPNVELVTAPITRIEDDCVICQDGTKKDIDVLILATGFQTTERSNTPRFPVTGPHERELGKFWDENGLQSYAGIAVKGFPNLFLASGPYSGGLNWFEMLRTHFGQIAKCLNKACDLKASRVEIGHQAHDRYVSEMRENSKRTVFKSGNCSSANSYYIDRHGEASLPSPRTPFWRAKFARRFGSRHFCFSSVGAKPD